MPTRIAHESARFAFVLGDVRILVITATDSCPNVATNFYVKRPVSLKQAVDSCVSH